MQSLEYSPYHWSASKERLNLIVGALAPIVAFPAESVTARILQSQLEHGDRYFIHQRIGLDTLKLRTMNGKDEPEKQNCSLTDRFTNQRIPNGWIVQAIRAARFDELPQIRHIKMREMNIVGHRPLPVHTFDKYAHVVHDHDPSLFKKLHAVYHDGVILPGLTGPAQILTGHKDDLSPDGMIREAISIVDYAEQATLRTDVHIALSTPLALGRSLTGRLLRRD